MSGRWFTLLLFAFPAWANTPHRVTLNPTPSITCKEILENVREALSPNITDLIFGDPIGMEVGVFKDLRRLALASGMERSTAMQAITLMDRTLGANRNKDTVLGTTLHYLEKHERDQQTLLVCILDGGCQLPVGTIFIPDESKTAMAELGSIPVRKPLSARIPHLILINGGPRPYVWQEITAQHAVAVAWVIDMLSSATAFADYELISDWIDANVTLLKAGKRSDELFDHYARVVPHRKIDVGFFRVLSSSRVTAATLAVVPMPQQQDLREESMKEIKSTWRETGKIVNRFALTSQNIVEFGERVTKEMAATIRRAATLPD